MEEGEKEMMSNIDYDKLSDVLYITLGEPQEAIAEEYESNIFIRRNQDSKIVGITIMQFEDRK